MTISSECALCGRAIVTLEGDEPLCDDCGFPSTAQGPSWDQPPDILTLEALERVLAEWMARPMLQETTRWERRRKPQAQAEAPPRLRDDGKWFLTEAEAEEYRRRQRDEELKRLFG